MTNNLGTVDFDSFTDFVILKARKSHVIMIPFGTDKTYDAGVDLTEYAFTFSTLSEADRQEIEDAYDTGDAINLTLEGYVNKTVRILTLRQSQVLLNVWSNAITCRGT